MKNIFLSLILLSGFLRIYAQEPVTVEKNSIVAVGEATLQNNEWLIELKQPIEPDKYFVMLTPVNANSGLYVTQKTARSFVVKSDTHSNAIFQYMVVYRNRKEVLVESDKKQ